MNEIERYIALANLKRLDTMCSDRHAEEMWHIIRALAVLDWALSQPERVEVLAPGNTEERFKTIMRKVQKLALQIIEEQGYTDSQKPN